MSTITLDTSTTPENDKPRKRRSRVLLGVGATALGQESYVRFKQETPQNAGLQTAVAHFVHPDKKVEIVLYGVVHIAEKEYYASVQKDLDSYTTVLFEGKPVGTPDAGVFWRVIADHKVKSMFTAPTAFRAIKKEDPNGDFIKKYDLSGFKALFLAGERCDPDTLTWADQWFMPIVRQAGPWPCWAPIFVPKM